MEKRVVVLDEEKGQEEEGVGEPEEFRDEGDDESFSGRERLCKDKKNEFPEGEEQQEEATSEGMTASEDHDEGKERGKNQVKGNIEVAKVAAELKVFVKDSVILLDKLYISKFREKEQKFGDV